MMIRRVAAAATRRALVLTNHGASFPRTTLSWPKRPVTRAMINRFKSSKGSKDQQPSPPSLKLVGQEHANVMEEKAARAAQIHAELETLLEQNARRRKESSGFTKFLKQHSSQFINIGASFLCVIFAYQLVGMKHAGRKLMQEKEDLEAELQQERSVLKGLQQEGFLQSVAQKCVKEVAQSNRQKASWRNFGGSSTNQQEQDATNRLVPVLKQELEGFIGDAGLSSEEKKTRAVAELQKENVSKSRSSSHDDMLLHELQASQADVVQVTQDDDGTQVVKRRQFSI